MAPDSPRIPLHPGDLSTYARIRNAALEGFAARGVAATSIRDVAAAAGVSPGLVQHHFGSKAGLRAAVNRYVVDVAVETFHALVQDGDDAERWAAMGDTTTAWVRDNATALRYLARAMAEGDAEASEIFKALVGIAQASWLAPLAEHGALRPEADVDWAAIHAIVFNLACVLFEPAISGYLGSPFFAPEQLRRWNVATTALYRDALTRPGPAGGDRSTSGRP